MTTSARGMRTDGWIAEPRWRSYVSVYRTMARVSVLRNLQYRLSTYLYMVGMVAEPVVYLVVWSTIARGHGGSCPPNRQPRLAARH